jgi:hypothetical protein
MWNVICDCGKELLISTANLTGGQTKSCGCYVAELRKKGMIKLNPESAIEEQYRLTKGQAKKRKHFCVPSAKNTYHHSSAQQRAVIHRPTDTVHFSQICS